MSRSSFPPTVPCPGAPFPPQGPVGRFPWFSGTMRHSDCLPPVSPHFVAFAWRYRRASTRSLPSVGRAPRTDLGFGHRSPDRAYWTETTSPPGFPGNPREHAPVSDPDETSASTVSTTQRCCLRHDIKPRLSHVDSYGAQFHGLLTPCERFAARVATGLAHHSVPAGDRPCRAGFTPAGFLHKVSI
jgi:hypothetical protein